MSFNNQISPGVSAFVARMRVRAAHPHGATLPVRSAPVTLAWRISPASGRLECRRLDEAQIEESQLRSRRRQRG